MDIVCEFATVEMIRRLAKGQFREHVDPREQALYTPADAACYLGIHPQTLGTWLWGRKYPTVGGEHFFAPLIEVADPANELLSFFNLAELHVLAACRYQHHISFKSIRTAMDTVQKKYAAEHPLISKDFKTNGRDIFVQSIAENTNLSNPQQLNFKNIMDAFLEHIITDEHDLAKKIFPLIAGQPDDRIISITYGISSSQPIIDGFGVPVWVIHNRSSDGEADESIADDFGMPVDRVRRAINYFEQRAA